MPTARSPSPTTAAACRSTCTRGRGSRGSRSSSPASTPAPSSRTRATASRAASTASASRSSTRSPSGSRSGSSAAASTGAWRSPTARRSSELKVDRQGGGAQHRHHRPLLARPGTSSTRRRSPSPSSSTCCAPRPCSARGCASASSTRGTPPTTRSWLYEDGLTAYLLDELAEDELVPAAPFVGHFRGTDEEVDWAVVWLPEDEDLVTESYVNLIPTTQGGTHVNGFRAGLTEAIREFCEFREPPAARRQDRARGRLGAVQLRALGADEGPAVHRPDQGPPLLARGRGIRLRRGAGRLRALAQPAHGGGRAHRAARDRRGRRRACGRARRSSGRR